MIAIPEEKREHARRIIRRVDDKLISEEGQVGYEASLVPEGVWVRSLRDFDPNQVSVLVRRLVEDLDLPGIYTVGWAQVCDSPAAGQFGGGAFAITRSLDTVWVDADLAATYRLVELCNKKGEAINDGQAGNRI